VAFDLQTLLMLELIILLAAFVQGAVGFAFGMVSMGLSVLLIDAKVASIMMAPLSTSNIVIVLWSVRHSVRLRNVGPMVVGMVAGLPLGLALLLGGSTALIRLLVGMLLLYVGITRLLGERWERKALSTAWGYAAGLLGGIVGGATNIGGPPLIAFAARQPWSPQVFKATLLTCFFAATAIKTIALVAEGSLNGPLLKSAGALLPAILVGSSIGIAVFNRVDQKLFGRLVSALVLILGVLLMI